MAVQVLLFREPAYSATASVCDHTPRLAGYPLLHLPLRVAHPTGVGTLEGVPNTTELRFFGRVRDDYNAEIRVDLSGRRPTAGMLSTAQRVLNGLVLPRWPHHC